MEIVLGAMEASLKVQLAEYLDEPTLIQFDRDADAITRLHLRGFIGDCECDRMRRRLIRMIKIQLNK
ncbi:MAG: hypothetical protein PHY09_18505 [Desulfuromonadaceae bacterium]|nr:hypothetical protein [Desulfuromonadaceae bacterium]MDD5107597.1 hypothetical protein [Desulfuromonadaceae bacterium]